MGGFALRFGAALSVARRAWWSWRHIRSELPAHSGASNLEAAAAGTAERGRIVTAPGGLLRAVGLFAVAQAVLLVVVGAVLHMMYKTPGDLSAITTAAWVALGVQLLTFSIVRLVSREQVIAAWGLGVLVRFAVVALWAFVLIPALALPATPALISLVAFLFVSTVVEPLFLNI